MFLPPPPPHPPHLHTYCFEIVPFIIAWNCLVWVSKAEKVFLKSRFIFYFVFYVDPWQCPKKQDFSYDEAPLSLQLICCAAKNFMSIGHCPRYRLIAGFFIIFQDIIWLQDSLTYGQCPERCICKWKGGKETVQCVNVTLSR